jgi:NitT/TauT family transport system substrate-binding protein
MPIIRRSLRPAPPASTTMKCSGAATRWHPRRKKRQAHDRYTATLLANAALFFYAKGISMTPHLSFLPRLAVLLAALLTWGMSAAADTKLTPVTMQLNWFAQPEFGGYYTAKAEGIYEKYGLDVTLKQGGPQLNIHQLLAAGQVDFIMGTAVRTLTVRGQGVPVVTIGAFFQKDPVTFVVHDGAGIEQLSDLKGKPIYLPGIARVNYWPWLKAKHGFSDEQIRPYDSSFRAFSLDKTSASQGYLTEGDYYFKKLGMNGKHLLLADYGWNPLSMTLDTTEKMIAEKPAIIEAFLKATAEGYRRYLQDPTSANALIKAANPQMDDENMAHKIKIMRSQGMVDPGNGAKIGSMTDARWEQTFKLLSESGTLPATLDYKAAYTLRFVKGL